MRSSAIAKIWPAMVALSAVALIAIATLMIDMLADGHTEAQMNALTDDALRGIRLGEDLRYQAYRLVDPAPNSERRAAIMATIKAESDAYEPPVTSTGEREEWSRLEGLLARATQQGPLAPGSPLLAEIQDSIGRLVEINRREVASTVAKIRGIYRSHLRTDEALACISITSAFAIAAILLRSHRGQRELLATHLASQDQRARELEAFAARVAHDLKGPLSPILIASEVLSTHKDPEVLSMSQRIRRGTTRMTQLIDELLSLSVSGHPSRGKTEVAPVVTELLEELQPALGDAKVDVAVADCTAACPSEVLSLVLRNLVGNASKYRSPERRLELHIDAACENGHVKIAIGDNGMGMDDETREHAFDPFFRAKAARGVEGHGLGLAIVKRTVEALGGSCLLDTALGQGTTVTLELPKVAQA